MILCCGCDAPYRPILDVLLHQARRFGWTPRVYDLGRLGMGKPWLVASFDGWTFKPAMIRHCVAKANGPVLYLDVDAIPLCDIAPAFERVQDVGVTIRRKREHDRKSAESRRFLGWTNAGMLAFRPTPAAFRFLDRWDTLTQRLGNDQTALNDLLYPHGEYVPPKTPFHCDDAMVYGVQGPIYNATGYYARRSAKAKVVHMTGGKWWPDLEQIRHDLGMR